MLNEHSISVALVFRRAIEKPKSWPFVYSVARHSTSLVASGDTAAYTDNDHHHCRGCRYQRLECGDGGGVLRMQPIQDDQQVRVRAWARGLVS
jgi:hypothetical protein